MAYGTVNTPGVSKAGLEDTEKLVQSTLEEAQAISGKVGATGDTGGSTTAGTIFGKLNKLLSDLATHMGRWTATRAGYIDTINTNAESIKTDVAAVKTDAAAAKSNTAANNTADATGTLSQKLAYIISQLTDGDVNEKLETIVTQTQNIGVVKSIQRGTAETVQTDDKWTYYIDVEINPVDADKCVVLLDDAGIAGNSTGIYLGSLTPSSFRVVSDDYEHTFSWQVIEFY